MDAAQPDEPKPDEPLDVTEDEVAVLAGRRAKAAPVVRRLVAHRPSGPVGRLVSDRTAPPRITAKEMLGIRRARRSTATVRERFTASEMPAEVVTEPREPTVRPERTPDAAS